MYVISKAGVINQPRAVVKPVLLVTQELSWQPSESAESCVVSAKSCVVRLVSQPQAQRGLNHSVKSCTCAMASVISPQRCCELAESRVIRPVSPRPKES